MNFIIRNEVNIEWRPITNDIVPGIKPYYFVSNYGDIYTTFNNKYMGQFDDGDGYLIVGLQTNYGRKTLRVHRLVMMAFNYIPGCELLEVNHKDGIHYHNWLWNLEWCTGKENVQHALENGLRPLGEEMYNSIFTDEEVHIICKLICDNKSDTEIEYIMKQKIYPREYNNIRGCINHIRNGYSWKHISSQYTFPEFQYETFSNDQIEIICSLLEKKYNYKEILTELGFNIEIMDKSTLNKYNRVISNIRSGRTYANISKKYNFDSGHYQIFSDDQIHQICKIFAEDYNIPLKNVLIKMGYDIENMDENKFKNLKSILSRIKNKAIFSNISDLYFSKSSTTIM